MINFVNKFLRLIPLLIMLQTAWNVFSWYEEYELKEAELNQRKLTLKEKIKKDEDWLAGIQEFMQDIDEQEKQVENVQKQIVTVQKQLPSEVSDTEILEFLSREAEIMNLQNISLQPKEEILNGFYFAKQFELTTTGTFHQILVYFERVGNAERLFNIKSMELLPTSDSAFRGRFQMVELNTVIESFRYNVNYKPGQEEG